MGGALRVLARPFKNINIENRAHRQLDRMEKGKPQPAPKHKLSRNAQRLYDESISQLGQDESLLQKDEGLAEKLRTLEVKSVDPASDRKAERSRPLPERRPPKEVTKFGEPIPRRTLKGKVNLEEVTTFLAEHQNRPKGFASDAIAKKYRLDSRKVEQVLLHYGLFKQLDFRDPKARKKQHWELKESQESVLKSMPADKSTSKRTKLSTADVLPGYSDFNKKES